MSDAKLGCGKDLHLVQHHIDGCREEDRSDSNENYAC